jgi:hypothetical protein
MAGSAHDIAAEGVLAVAEKAGLEGDPRSRAPTLVREDWSLSAIQSRCDPSGNRGAEPRYVEALAAELLEDAREHLRDGSASTSRNGRSRRAGLKFRYGTPDNWRNGPITRIVITSPVWSAGGI